MSAARRGLELQSQGTPAKFQQNVLYLNLTSSADTASGMNFVTGRYLVPYGLQAMTGCSTGTEARAPGTLSAAPLSSAAHAAAPPHPAPQEPRARRRPGRQARISQTRPAACRARPARTAAPARRTWRPWPRVPFPPVRQRLRRRRPRCLHGACEISSVKYELKNAKHHNTAQLIIDTCLFETA